VADAPADIGLAALVVVRPEILAELLQLPPGCHIDAATAPYDQPGVLHLRVRGAGYQTKAGWLLPQVTGNVTRRGGEELNPVINWSFPKTENGASHE
jgi:hypothetical protein